MDGMTLVCAARAAGLTVWADHKRLFVEGPRDAEPLARQLLARKSNVMAALTLMDGQWHEWTEQRGGRIWRVIQRDGVEVVPWEDCRLWQS